MARRASSAGALTLLMLFLAGGVVSPLLSVPVALAQTSSQASLFAADDPVSKAPAQLDTIRSTLDSIATDLKGMSDNDRELIGAKSRLDDAMADLITLKSSLSPRLDDLTSRLTELGNPPKDGQPEAADVTAQRNKLTAQKGQVVSLLSRIDDLTKADNDLETNISTMRRELFTRELFAHADVSIDTMTTAVKAVGPLYAQFAAMVGSWVGFVWYFKRISLASALLVSLVMMLGLRFILHQIFGPMIARARLEEKPSYMSRFSLAFWVTVVPSVALGFFLIASFFLLDAFNVLRSDIRPVLASVFGVIVTIFFSARLAVVVFNPKQPKWRLVRVSDRGARGLAAAFVAMTIINGFDYVFGVITSVAGGPVDLAVLRGFVSSCLVGLILLIISFTKPLMPKEDDPPGVKGRPWSRKTLVLLHIFGFGIVFAALIGYVGLAKFIANQIILTGGMIALIYIGIRSGKAVSERDRFAETTVGRYLQRRFDAGPVALDQLGIAAGLVIYLVALMVGLPLILLSWGFQPLDIRLLMYNFVTEIKIGGISISVVGIAGGILLFILGLIVTRWLEKWLDGTVMARAQVDSGVRNSIRTVVGYVGASLAGVISLSAAGINLSNLALVAGALSVGIGFGLQNIVSNFVSGLILLVERPFKVGDWVATGTTEGFVRRINVRATEIETFQRQTIIVPNSELINAAVGNWTHRNTLGRVDVKIGVSYDSDPTHVMRVLQEAAATYEGVLRNPEPFVIFQNFGNSSLDFQLCFFIGDVLNALSIKNGVRVRIFERFREEGIEIPFPRQDLTVTMVRPPETPPDSVPL
ncbi:mechanosensitive ion channel family protein [Allorhizobium sonneratiae]|uniref:mechanosensitive ion channel family protein n=1 Tax=Allorhizobium sonneratiae TaxID=2934936 RepID=UPI0020340180|nr:mechanosensitive ion channel domain-containing protein [Allorhizobium sonneratiae]